ncbi:MAG: PIN domain-containing protein [Anaerolineae bacterium]|nr:PIN domain-containing protein [Anaerolineae bacterium]
MVGTYLFDTNIIIAYLNREEGVRQRLGEIKNELQAKGRPIPENDIWIAAIAKQHDLTLATRDAHFGAVDGLQTETW